MSRRPSDVATRLRATQADLEAEVAIQSRRWHYRIHEGRVHFERQARAAHRALKRSMPRYLRESSVSNLLTAPLIYSMIVPFVVLDVWLSLYQQICFPIYGIPRIRRRDYMIVDRHRLDYLNSIEKANCLYCGYANGLAAYLREIAARTEQYWCPIKHARAVRDPHVHYPSFVDYGDAEGYHTRLPALRASWRARKRSRKGHQRR